MMKIQISMFSGGVSLNEYRYKNNLGGADKDDWWVALFKGDKFQIRYCVPPIDEWEDEE